MSTGKSASHAHGAILVVDADPAVQELVANLESVAEFEHAPDNEAALAMVRRRPFDVVLTSTKTCGATDIELLRSIRRINPHTRMIILADKGTPADVIAAMRANAFSFFIAPFPPHQLKEMLRTALEAPPWDDGIELVSATPSWIHLYARCELTTADRLVQFINEIAAELPEDERADVSMAFREMLMNAIEHGGHFDPNEYVEISYFRSRRAVSCRIRDPGKGFLLEDIPHAAVSNPQDNPVLHMERRAEQNLRPGGYGILVARKLVDELIHSETGNEVVLIKYLDHPPSEATHTAAG
jgi:anti-sigma regulatory factor (Ser/Thr protein kinase)/CheY-like chemotaxis protein